MRLCLTYFIVPLVSFIAFSFYLEYGGLHLSPPPPPKLPASSEELWALIDAEPATDVYNHRPAEGPVLRGLSLRFFAALTRVPLLGRIISEKLMADNGFAELSLFSGRIPHRQPLFHPYVRPTEEQTMRHTRVAARVGQHQQEGVVPAWVTNSRIADLAHAYRNGSLNPVRHIQTVLDNIASETHNESLRAFVDVDRDGALACARLSNQRIQNRMSFGILDGIPVGVKTEVNVEGLPNDFGSRMRAGSRATEDARIVTRLRAAGACIIGVTNMVEFGAATAGFNSLYGSSLNAFNPAYLTGGSSGGSASAVASGLVPLAIGADGGGSCRIPAALSGLVSLKQSWGRLDSPRDHEFAWTVAHICPMVVTVDDARIAYEWLAPRDGDSVDARYPFPPAHSIEYAPSLQGTRVCVDDQWNGDSSGDQQAAVKEVEARLRAAGAKVSTIKIPFLRETFLAHVVTIASEMLSGVTPYGANLTMSDHDVQITLRTMSTLSAATYVNAQIARHYLTNVVWAGVWNRCEILLSPATGSVATAAIPEPDGEINLQNTADRMRFSFPANLLGYPAIVIPVHINGEGLPTSVALHAQNFEESVLFKAAKLAERKDQLKPKKNFYPNL